MLIGTKFSINILALEGEPCATNDHEVQQTTFVTSIPTDSREMEDDAHSVHLEGEVEEPRLWRQPPPPEVETDHAVHRQW